MAGHSSQLPTWVITLTRSLSSDPTLKEAVATGESLFPAVNVSYYVSFFVDEVFDQRPQVERGGCQWRVTFPS